MATLQTFSNKKAVGKANERIQQLSFLGELFVKESGITPEEHIRLLQQQALADNKERNRYRAIIRFQKAAYRKAHELLVVLANGEYDASPATKARVKVVLEELNALARKANEVHESLHSEIR